MGREKDIPESGLAQFKRRATLSRRKAGTPSGTPVPPIEEKTSFWDSIAPGPKDAWMVYCWILTCCVPPFLLSTCGTFRASISYRCFAIAPLRLPLRYPIFGCPSASCQLCSSLRCSGLPGAIFSRCAISSLCPQGAVYVHRITLRPRHIRCFSPLLPFSDFTIRFAL